jgi:aspartyl/asparaginyl-tRNA synthetase
MVQVRKKMDGNANRVINDELFVDERKPSSMTAVKVNLHNGEHTLIPATVKMIHSAVRDCKRFVLKDSRPLHMVKLVGAVRNFRVHDKHVQINLEDGTGLLRIIFWQKHKKCTAQHHLIEECNRNCYIRVIGEVADYYGVHEIIAFNIQPVSSGNKVTHHFLEVACSYEKRLESVEDEMMKSVLHV